MGLVYIVKHYLSFLIIIILLFLYLTASPGCEEEAEVEPHGFQEFENTPKFGDAKVKWAESIIQNITNSKAVSSISLAHLFNAIPHLRSLDASVLEPVYLVPNKTTRRRLVISVPAIERPRESYLLTTLQSLVKWVTEDDRENVTIMLFLSNEEGEQSFFVKNTTASVKQLFPKEIEDGFIQIIMIPVLYYPPDLDKVVPTFNDSTTRMYWRTKQNLDFMYIMTYASHFGEYFLQLEDDILASKGYIQNIFYFIEIQQRHPWMMMEFSSLGCIGKLVRSSDLYMYIVAISMFYKNKPVDWILDDFLRNKYCTPEWNSKKCYVEVSKYRLMYEPVQFQHIGKHSSLKGKLQKLKEKTWGTNNLKKKRNNPPAAVSTNMVLKNMKFTLQNAYTRSAIFQPKAPKKGEFVEIKFTQPENVTTVMFSSGTAESPEQQFSDETTISIVALGGLKEIGRFDKYGRFMCKLNGEPIDGIRITVGETLSHDVLLDQLAITV